MGGQEASGNSGCFLCRGTDELLGVMDQVTIINSTLGKALGGASGAYGILSVGSPSLHALYGVEKEGEGNWRGGQFLAPDWLLFHIIFCLQGAIPLGLSLWYPCYVSVLGPTSSPTARPLLLLAVLLRPWTCSWRTAPSSSLWLLRPGGMVPTWVERDGGEMVVTHLFTSSCSPSSFPSHLPLSQHPPWIPPVPFFSPYFPTSLYPVCLCLPLPVPPLLFGSVLLSLFLPLIGGLDPGPLLLAPWPSATCDTQLCPQVPQ